MRMLKIGTQGLTYLILCNTHLFVYNIYIYMYILYYIPVLYMYTQSLLCLFVFFDIKFSLYTQKIPVIT